MGEVNIKNNHEVEVRALLSDNDRASIFKRLSERGAMMISEEFLEDSYWCPNGTRFFSEIEMNEIGSYSLRIRKNSSGVTQLNVKAITKKNDHNAWDEHEVTVNSYEGMSSILETIGFKNFFTFKKHRYSFKIKQFTILVEDIDEFGPIIEVEILTDKQSAIGAKEMITDLLSRELGVDPSKMVPKSVTNLLMKKRSRF